MHQPRKFNLSFGDVVLKAVAASMLGPTIVEVGQSQLWLLESDCSELARCVSSLTQGDAEHVTRKATIDGGFKVIDANGQSLAYVYGRCWYGPRAHHGRGSTHREQHR
jgi:hypothetical protein